MTEFDPETFRYPAWHPEFEVAESEWEFVCREIHLADVVVVHDRKRDLKAIIYGQKLMQHIVTTGEEQPCRFTEFDVDMDTRGLEALCALCDVMKGGHDNPDGKWKPARDFSA